MRILHLISTISPEAGGPTEAVRMMVDFAPPHITSEVLTADDPNAPFIDAFPCKVFALGPPTGGYLYSPNIVPWLRANRSRFDGVIVHGLWSYATVATLRAVAGHTPYVVFPHGMLDPYFKRAFPLKHAKKWLSWLFAEYWLLRRARYTLFTTAAERDLAQQSFWLWRWNPLIAPLGTEPVSATSTDLEAFFTLCPAIRNTDARSADGTAKRFLLFLGRIHPKKGCDLLLEAFTRTAALAPDLHLVVAGPDPANWQPQLAAIAANAGLTNRVHFPGMLKGAAKTGAFAACEAFVLPSHQENFGIAVVEALAAARPVLLSDKINIAPDIAADHSGFMQPDTLEGTIRLLQQWIALTPADRAAMSTRALATFHARYNMRQNTEAILRVFETTK